MASETNAKASAKADEAEREKAIRRMADLVHQMNQAVSKAVDLGMTVELVRVSRYHDEKGQWGDQMIPVVREPEAVPDESAADMA